jgi:WD40 repeat protein
VAAAGGGVEAALANLQLKDDDHHDDDTTTEEQKSSPTPLQLLEDETETTPFDWNDDSHDYFHLEPNPIQNSNSGGYGYDDQQQQQQQHQAPNESSSSVVFTDEELVAALLSSCNVNDDDDDDSHEGITSAGLFLEGGGTTSADLLPDIEVLDDDLDDFLAPDQLDSVFDNHDDNTLNNYDYEADDYSPVVNDNDNNDNDYRIPKDSSSDDDTTTQNNNNEIIESSSTIEQHKDDEQQQQQQQQQHYDDSHQLQLELASLSLGDYDDWNPEIPDDWDLIGGGSSTDGLPPYMYCQPCDIQVQQPGDIYFEQLHQLLPPIEEDEPLSDQKARLERQSIIEQTQTAALARRHGSGDLKKGKEQEELTLPSLDLLNLGTTEDEQEFSQGMDNPELEERHETPADPIRKQAIDAAKPFWEAFGLGDGEKSKERTCFGHKETIFGLSFSQDGKYCATASQDSTVHVWDVEKNVRVSALAEHSTEYECLRAAWASDMWSSDVLDRSSSQGDTKHLLASGGADGTVKLWGCQDPKKGNWKCHTTLDHSKLGKRGEQPKQGGDNDDDDTEGTKDKENKPQVYATAFIDHWKAFTTEEESTSTTTTRNSFLMTSSDDYIHLWEIEATPSDQQIQLLDQDVRVLQTDDISLKEVMSLHFGELDDYGYGVTVCSVTGSGLRLPPAPKPEPKDDDNGDGDQGPADGHPTPFGGERNPNNMIFVFDATYCPANGLLGVALSDGSLRLVNGRGVCVSIINLPGCQSHLTSFCWDSTGTRLATCVATGHLIAWELDISEADSGIAATCKAIMEGGKLLFYCAATDICFAAFLSHFNLVLILFRSLACLFRPPNGPTLVWLPVLWYQRRLANILGRGWKSVLVGFLGTWECSFSDFRATIQ